MPLIQILLGFVILLLIALWLDGERRDRRHEASLQAIQLQLAFIAGRIGLRNQDLRNVTTAPNEPEGKPEVLGEDRWDDLPGLAELIYARGERTGREHGGDDQP